jgi:hypothetical protein
MSLDRFPEVHRPEPPRDTAREELPSLDISDLIAAQERLFVQPARPFEGDQPISIDLERPTAKPPMKTIGPLARMKTPAPREIERHPLLKKAVLLTLVALLSLAIARAFSVL